MKQEDLEWLRNVGNLNATESTLLDEIERLRGALTQIVQKSEQFSSEFLSADERFAYRIARQALEGQNF